MKLRNKKTGEIAEFIVHKRVEDSEDGNKVYAQVVIKPDEWEDYEEPENYFINAVGHVDIYALTDKRARENFYKQLKEIGNYFETKEEAEKAVKKLKAWKRLKDKGFRFIDHIDRDTGQGMTRYEWDGYINGEDLDLLFGGEG